MGGGLRFSIQLSYVASVVEDADCCLTFAESDPECYYVLVQSPV